MKKQQKDNLIKALEELNAPDKNVLLQKTQSKKALGGEFESSSRKEYVKAKRKKRVAWTSFACSFVVIALAIVLISISVFGGKDGSSGNNNDGSNIGADVIDYRYSWQFDIDYNISFALTDKSIKDSGISLIYGYKEGWTIAKTQVTQDESAYREYYVKDGVTVEVTVLLEEKVTGMDGRYNAILRNADDSFVHGKYLVYTNRYSVNGSYKQAYVIYLKDQVYIFTSDVDLKQLI